MTIAINKRLETCETESIPPLEKNSKYFLENVYCFRKLKDMKSNDINQDLKKNRQKREIKRI